jgi:hypothetical protein
VVVQVVEVMDEVAAGKGLIEASAEMAAATASAEMGMGMGLMSTLLFAIKKGFAHLPAFVNIGAAGSPP